MSETLYFNDDLDAILHQKAEVNSEWVEPNLYDLNDDRDRAAVHHRVKSGHIETVVDNVDVIADELYEIDNPSKKDDVAARAEYVEDIKNQGTGFGTWVEFPQDKKLVRYPDVDDHRRLRTARFRNIVTDNEQNSLYDANVAVYGLSVGSSVVEALSMAGVGGKYILGDFDKLAPTNLGRFRTGFENIGKDKLGIVADKISKTDPYIEQIHHAKGFNSSAIDELLDNNPDVMFDEVDNMAAKALMRIVARKNGIPLVMATDLGDRSVIDVERYDLKSEEVKPFHGKLSELEVEKMANGEMTEDELRRMPAKILGLRHVTTRMLQSVVEVDKTLAGLPQLGSTATVGGVLASTAAREIILGNKLNSGRYVFNPKQTLKLAPQADIPTALKTAAHFIRSQRAK